MRLHTFTLVVFTAVLAHSANPAKASNSTTTEGAPSARLRSSDACCDDVPVEQGLVPHETTAVEERMPEPWIPSSINSAVARLVEKLHAQYPKELAVEHLPEHGWQAFDEIALRHLYRLEAADKTTEQLPEHAQIVDRWLQNELEKGPRLIAEARQSFLSHEADMGAKAYQSLLAHRAEMGVEVHQSSLAYQLKMAAEAHRYFVAHQAEMGLMALNFLDSQAEMTANAHRYFLARQVEMTAEAHLDILAHQLERGVEAHHFFRAHLEKMTAEAHKHFRTNQVKMATEAYQYFLTHEAEMTAQARQYFLTYQAEMTAIAYLSFLADQAELTAEATQSFLAHKAELGADAILRHQMDPSAYFDIMYQKAKADAAKQVNGREESPIASLDLGSLDKYMKEYNTLHGSEELTLRKVMSRCIRDDAELESILSILNQGNNMIFVKSMRISQKVEDAVVEYGMISQTTRVLDAENRNNFVEFIAKLAKTNDEDIHSLIVEQLARMFDDLGAASLVYLLKYRWKDAFKHLRLKLFEHLANEGTTPAMLDNKIEKARKERAEGIGRRGLLGERYEKQREDALLNDYRLYYESPQNRKGNGQADTSTGPS
ncbi:unnamed protein product [Hyaloperonospora brassicae]|uniref:RxLR effector candidate protein n=1 Tax=Hyaloperonospora brassicae TaxID=162125 RepID=A0AAV0V172_HYABA|nr:unnamed protein product [Hyaloperonospora brassicae]